MDKSGKPCGRKKKLSTGKPGKKKVLHRCNRETRVSCLSTGESRSIHMEMWKNSREKEKAVLRGFQSLLLILAVMSRMVSFKGEALFCSVCSTFLSPCMTVVWSRSNSRPISGRDRFVIV